MRRAPAARRSRSDFHPLLWQPEGLPCAGHKRSQKNNSLALFHLQTFFTSPRSPRFYAENGKELPRHRKTRIFIMHISTPTTVRHQVAPLEMRLILPPFSLPHRACQRAAAQSPYPALCRQTASPRKHPLFPFLEAAKKWGFLTRSPYIFIERQIFTPVTSRFAGKIFRLPCRSVPPCDIVNLSNARLQEASPTSHTERQKKHGSR